MKDGLQLNSNQIEERLAPLAVFHHTGDVVELKKIHRIVAVAGIPEIVERVISIIEAQPGDAWISPE